jgi:hypothetical protein
VVLLITIGINVMFILDTNRRLHEEIPTTGIDKVTDFSRVGMCLHSPFIMAVCMERISNWPCHTTTEPACSMPVYTFINELHYQ